MGPRAFARNCTLCATLHPSCVHTTGTQALSSALEDVPQEPSALGKAEATLAQALLTLVKHADKVGPLPA